MKKTTTALAMCLALVLLFSGCSLLDSPADISLPEQLPASSLPVPGERELRIMCSLPTFEEEMMLQLARGVQDYCDVHNIEVVMHNAGGSIDAQQSGIADFITGGGDALLCLPIDANTMQAHYQSAHDNGMVVVDFGTAHPLSDATLNYSDHASGLLLGEDAAAWAAVNLYSPVHVLIFQHTGSAEEGSAAAGIEEAFLQRLSSAQIQRVAVASDDEARQEMQLLIQAGDVPNVVLSDSDGYALAAWQALFEQSEDATPANPGNYYFGSIGGGDVMLETINSGGSMRATVAVRPYELGAAWVELAVMATQGGAESITHNPQLYTGLTQTDNQ